MKLCSDDCCGDMFTWSVLSATIRLITDLSWRNRLYPTDVIPDDQGGVHLVFRSNKRTLRFEIYSDGTIIGLAYEPEKPPVKEDFTLSEHGLDRIYKMAKNWKES